MFNPPELAIFDLDNTLYDYEIANATGQAALISFLSKHLGRPELEVSRLLAESRLRVKGRLGSTASSHSRLLYIRELLVLLNIHTNASFALECEQVYWREYLKKTQLFPGVEEFLSLLRLAGTRLAMVTDHSSQIQLRKLNWLSLDKTFDVIVTSEEAGGDKITNLPSRMLKDLVPIEGDVWCIGDNDWDYLFQEDSIFLKKVMKGKISPMGANSFQFSDYFELSREIKFE